MWKEKFSLYSSIKILDFYDAESLDKNMLNNIKADAYLIDYQLLRNKLNGLDIIENLNLGEKSYLVTSNFEDIIIRKKCAEIGIKIIPKPFVPYINVTIKNDDINNTIFGSLETEDKESNLLISVLDDEEEVLDNWRSVLGQKNVFYFTHPDDFMLAFSDDSDVKKTNLIITDYYFNNSPVTKLLDIKMLKHVLKFNGKIFLFSNIGNIDLKSSFFDYMFPEKSSYYNKKQLKNILDKILTKE